MSSSEHRVKCFLLSDLFDATALVPLACLGMYGRVFNITCLLQGVSIAPSVCQP